jgi:hypothetical protein
MKVRRVAAFLPIDLIMVSPTMERSARRMNQDLLRNYLQVVAIPA